MRVFYIKAEARYVVYVIIVLLTLLMLRRALKRPQMYREQPVQTFEEINRPFQYLTNRNSERGKELVLVQMLFRHGHRSPFMLYPTDPNNETIWPEGFGMLTKLGRLQHYAMGAHLQNWYKDFITTNPNEVKLVNSNNFRCQYGVYAFMAGLYAPKSEYAFTNELRWQPITSEHVPSEGTGEFMLSKTPCPLSDVEEHLLKMGPEFVHFVHKYRSLYYFWSVNSGREVISPKIAADLGKTMHCEREYNMTVPEWGLKYWDEFEFQAAVSYFFNYGTKIIQRYRIGPLIGYMIEKMTEKVVGKFPEKRVFIYSAHGSNIVALMLTMNSFNWRTPPYASTIVQELWRDTDGDYLIRWLYFNSSNPEKHIGPPIVLRVAGCGEFCSLYQYADLMKPFIPLDWVAECNNLTQEFFRLLESDIKIPNVPISMSTVGSNPPSFAVISIITLHFFMRSLINKVFI